MHSVGAEYPGQLAQGAGSMNGSGRRLIGRCLAYHIVALDVRRALLLRLINKEKIPPVGVIFHRRKYVYTFCLRK